MTKTGVVQDVLQPGCQGPLGWRKLMRSDEGLRCSHLDRWTGGWMDGEVVRWRNGGMDG